MGKSKREKELEERIAELEKQNLEYQYRVGEKRRPSPRLSMAEYLFGLYNLDIWKNYLDKNFVVTGAVSGKAEIRRGGFPLFVLYNLYIPLSYTIGKTQYTTEFKIPLGYSRNKEQEDALFEITGPLTGQADQDFVVLSHRNSMVSRKTHLFLNGYVDDEGTEIFIREAAERNLYKQREQNKSNVTLQQEGKSAEAQPNN